MILTPPEPALIRRVVGDDEHGPVTAWLFLGDRPETAIAFRNLTGPQLQMMEMSDSLQAAARRHRQHYIDWVGELTRSQCGIP